MNGKSLELFFIDGEPDGLLTAEVFNWTGHVLSIPRTKLVSALSRQEAKNTGVYVLLGENDGEEMMYVGEGENISNRIKLHDAKKDWWTRAVLVTTTSDALNKAHVQYLESKLIEKAIRAGHTKLDNSAKPSLPGINEAAQANMEGFLEQLFVVLRAIRVDAFTEQARHGTETGADKPNEVFELVLKKEGIKATAVLDGSEFIVQSGSSAREAWIGDRTPQTSYWKLHDQLVTQGILVEGSDGNRAFSVNYAFSSTSAAGAVVTGRSTAGPLTWKHVKSGMTYRDWEADLLSKRVEEP